MKKYLLILATIINFGNLKAKSDSLTYKTDSIYNTNFIEPIVIKDSSSEECLILELNQTKKNEHNNNIKIKNNLEHITKTANWFTDAWDAFTDLFKPVWGYYEEDGQRKEGPYFLFDRNIDGPSYTQIQMDRMRTFILQDIPKLNSIYKQIFLLAGNTTIDNCNSKNGICASAARAKASAFVYLVGLNGAGTALNNTEREGYRDRALAYLRDVKIDGLNNIFDYIGYIPMEPVSYTIVNTITNSIAAGSQWSQLIWRAKELQML